MESTKRSQLRLPNIALLPPSGLISHLIPFIELAKDLVSHHNFTVTLILSDDGTPMKFQRSLLARLPAKITPVFLPPVATDDLPEGVGPEDLLPVRVSRSLPALRYAMWTTPAAALVVDLFTPAAIAIARELGIPAYIFYVKAANELSLALDLSELDRSYTSEFGDVQDPVELPGDTFLKSDDLSNSMLDLSKKTVLADAIFVNSFQELEPEALKHLALGTPPVYPVGPLIGAIEESESDRLSDCLRWLDDQPPQSVLFISFGSGGTPSWEQLRELALGLEMSGQRFLWVVQSPPADHWDPLGFLPEGFLGRTEGRGLVITSWAPKIRVLSHGSTGGFLTHCEWNSILEGAVNGVPLIVWPLCFEHKMNAVCLTEGLKSAIRVRESENGIVEREDISNVVKELMEGEEGKRIRKRMNQLKIAAANVVSGEGSSTWPIAELLQNLSYGK